MIETLNKQTWSADDYATNARFVPDLGAPVLELLNPKAGERILDLGCGDGYLTEQISASGASVLAADMSDALLEKARARGLETQNLDGQKLTFNGEFDAVFSNAALHWMPDGPAVVAGVARALKPGGRFVAEMGGFGNVAAITTALRAALQNHGVALPSPYPWFFPSAEHYQSLLIGAGFQVVQMTLFPRPTPLPTGIAGWLKTFAHPFTGGLSNTREATILADTEALLTQSLRDEYGNWHADYVRLRFEAIKPG